MALETSLSLLDRLTRCTDDLSWEQFLSIYRPLIERQLVRMKIAAQDVDDILQETCKTVHQSLHRFTHNGRVGAFRCWLYSIVHQRASQYRRALNKQQGLGQGPMVADPIDDANDLEAAWDVEHDRYVVQRLLTMIQPEFTKTTWLAFDMQSNQGQSPAQVAESLGISVNAVMIAKSRVLRRLRQLGRQLVDFGKES